MQSQDIIVAIDEAFSDGSLWGSTAILLKIVEEVGELSAAYSRDRGSESEEIGDVLFAAFAFCKAEGIDARKAIQTAIDKHRQLIDSGDSRTNHPTIS